MRTDEAFNQLQNLKIILYTNLHKIWNQIWFYYIKDMAKCQLLISIYNLPNFYQRNCNIKTKTKTKNGESNTAQWERYLPPSLPFKFDHQNPHGRRNEAALISCSLISIPPYPKQIHKYMNAIINQRKNFLIFSPVLSNLYCLSHIFIGFSIYERKVQKAIVTLNTLNYGRLLVQHAGNLGYHVQHFMKLMNDASCL